MTWNPDEAKWAVRHLWAQKRTGGSMEVGETITVVAALNLRLQAMRFLEVACGAFIVLTIGQHSTDLLKELAAHPVDAPANRRRVNQPLQLSGKVRFAEP